MPSPASRVATAAAPVTVRRKWRLRPVRATAPLRACALLRMLTPRGDGVGGCWSARSVGRPLAQPAGGLAAAVAAAAPVGGSGAARAGKRGPRAARHAQDGHRPDEPRRASDAGRGAPVPPAAVLGPRPHPAAVPSEPRALHRAAPDAQDPGGIRADRRRLAHPHVDRQARRRHGRPAGQDVPVDRYDDGRMERGEAYPLAGALTGSHVLAGRAAGHGQGRTSTTSPSAMRTRSPKRRLP